MFEIYITTSDQLKLLYYFYLFMLDIAVYLEVVDYFYLCSVVLLLTAWMFQEKYIEYLSIPIMIFYLNQILDIDVTDW